MGQLGQLSSYLVDGLRGGVRAGRHIEPGQPSAAVVRLERIDGIGQPELLTHTLEEAAAHAATQRERDQDSRIAPRVAMGKERATDAGVCLRALPAEVVFARRGRLRRPNLGRPGSPTGREVAADLLQQGLVLDVARRHEDARRGLIGPLPDRP